ncbi:hypothetical protein OAN61_00770 [bacterium]|nr:hypothetical protein [bacterium]
MRCTHAARSAPVRGGTPSKRVAMHRDGLEDGGTMRADQRLARMSV